MSDSREVARFGIADEPDTTLSEEDGAQRPEPNGVAVECPECNCRPRTRSSQRVSAAQSEGAAFCPILRWSASCIGLDRWFRHIIMPSQRSFCSSADTALLATTFVATCPARPVLP